MTLVQPDKVRFCDPEATTNGFLIHTVELSDARSVQAFLTFWCKGGRDQGPRSQAWATAHGLTGHHNREVYHRESDPWLPQQYPGQESQGWSKHYHADLTHTPTWADVLPFCDEVPPVLQEAIQAYLAGGV